MSALAQAAHGVRFDWGLAGGAAIAAGADVAVVVDTLTFSTTLSVAADLGVVVLAYGEESGDVEAFAAQHRAVVLDASSAGLRDARPDRVVVPSPGSTLAHALRPLATTVVGAALRNARAVADWIAREHDAETATIAVVAAGESWPGGSLRPCLEDLWAAGAVLAALEDHDWPGLSPEAAMAADAYRLIEGREATHLLASASGGLLVEAGLTEDVEIAAEVGSSTVVPLLSDRGFIAAP